MALKGPRGGKLAQLVSHHVLGDIHRHMLAAVVDRDGVANEIMEDLLQVLTIFFSPASFMAWILFSSTGCTKGPFFRLLLIVSLLLSRAPYLPFLRFTINLSLRFFFLRVL